MLPGPAAVVVVPTNIALLYKLMVLPLSPIAAESISLPLMLTVNGTVPDVGVTLIETDVVIRATAVTVTIELLAIYSLNM
jgi:hypothetical protein